MTKPRKTEIGLGQLAVQNLVEKNSTQKELGAKTFAWLHEQSALTRTTSPMFGARRGRSYWALHPFVHPFVTSVSPADMVSNFWLTKC